MIAVIIADDGLHFRVVRQEPSGEILDITDQYLIQPMAIEVGGRSSVGFHIGQPLPQEIIPS